MKKKLCQRVQWIEGYGLEYKVQIMYSHRVDNLPYILVEKIQIKPPKHGFNVYLYRAKCGHYRRITASNSRLNFFIYFPALCHPLQRPTKTVLTSCPSTLPKFF